MQRGNGYGNGDAEGEKSASSYDDGKQDASSWRQRVSVNYQKRRQKPKDTSKALLKMAHKLRPLRAVRLPLLPASQGGEDVFRKTRGQVIERAVALERSLGLLPDAKDDSRDDSEVRYPAIRLGFLIILMLVSRCCFCCCISSYLSLSLSLSSHIYTTGCRQDSI
jgi:hypothetical protein